MNQNPGVIGRKIGMTQVIEADGTVIPCTVVQAAVTVVGKRTQEKDGYDALILGIEPRKEKHTNKPLAGFYKKQGVEPKRVLRELRCAAEYAAGFEVGQQLKVDEIFEQGQFVDVQGVTRGRGFTGVMRRHNFAGAKSSHGSHEYKRHGGSIGSNMTPGRVLPGKKMAGQYGNETMSILNQRVVRVLPEENLILVRGGIPGSKNGLVVVRGAVKKKNGGKSAQS
ncbi:MAG: 50S ribosomal protein L3 [Myxococcales bacterium]|jgi:large subunit ribosomal protein L3|nr:50S ribosomal protein L3 [Myxococcales bacterium]